jgi:hypothetical protein
MLTRGGRGRFDGQPGRRRRLVVLIDPADDAIRLDSQAVRALELVSEKMSDSMRVGNQTAEAELDDGPYDSW